MVFLGILLFGGVVLAYFWYQESAPPPALDEPPAEAPTFPAQPTPVAAPEETPTEDGIPEEPVATTPERPGSPEPPRAPAPAGTRGFTVQVSAFKVRQNAERLEAALRTNGLAVYIVEADLPELGHFYRVRVGPFSTIPDARTAGSQIVNDMAQLVEFWVDNYPD